MCAALAFTLTACADRPTGVHMERAALVVPAGGSLAVLYFTAVNGDARADTIYSVKVDGAESVSMHAPMRDGAGGVNPMADAAMVPLPANSRVRFAPGGTHVMVRISGFPLRRGTDVRVVLMRTHGDSTVGMARVVDYADLDTLLGPSKRAP
jgi:copper(I)-binding protein